MLLVVNYHYIGEAIFSHPGIHPLPPQVLRRQIEELARHFEFVAEGIRTGVSKSMFSIRVVNEFIVNLSGFHFSFKCVY